MKYRVVPFVASIDFNTGTSDHVAQQLEQLINENTAEGGVYVRLESH